MADKPTSSVAPSRSDYQLAKEDAVKIDSRASHRLARTLRPKNYLR
jgi:hypothetical protein